MDFTDPEQTPLTDPVPEQVPWVTPETAQANEEAQSICCSCGPVQMDPEATIEWTAPVITVNLPGQVITLGTPNTDLDGNGRAETFTGPDGTSIVQVTDANGDGTGESFAIYNSAGQLTAAMALDPTTGTWTPLTADAFQPALSDPALAPSYDVVGPGTAPLTTASDPAGPACRSR